jgi:hypothetical protein
VRLFGFAVSIDHPANHADGRSHQHVIAHQIASVISTATVIRFGGRGGR